VFYNNGAQVGFIKQTGPFIKKRVTNGNKIAKLHDKLSVHLASGIKLI
jgi:hypothetical protein